MSQVAQTNKNLKAQISPPNWFSLDKDIALQTTSGAYDRLDIVKQELEALDAVRVFEKIFDDAVINHIVTQTNIYSTQKNDHQFFVSSPDIKLFITILLLTGYHELPRQRLYWSLEEDTSVSFVSNAMSRNRFEDIKRYLHLADNNNLDVSGANKIPLGSSVVLDLLENIAVPSDHAVFFDNFFTSYDLLQTLRQKGLRATGTVRENRTKKCPMSDNKTFKKMERGYFEYKYSDSNVLFVRWKDNSVVTLGTNYDAVEPVSKVKRWSTAQKQKVDVSQPYLFQNYNKHMGGVDLLDQSVSTYRINIRGKKWWWCLFTHMINVGVVNAWRLYQLTNPGVDLLEYQRAIVTLYVKCYGKYQIVPLKQRRVANVSENVRHQEGGHFPEKLEKQLRCAQCHLRARWRCRKCMVTLCLERECFVEYHS
nr:unnamed protein product [Callosobruchus chinensis]